MELVFPLRSIPMVISSLPKPLLLICSPETLSHYRCQHPSCDQKFSQKVVACNHVCCNHLYVPLACLYCSAYNSPKMHWYSVSAWEHYTHKHIQENLPIHPDDPSFYQQFSETISPTVEARRRPPIHSSI